MLLLSEHPLQFVQDAFPPSAFCKKQWKVKPHPSLTIRRPYLGQWQPNLDLVHFAACRARSVKYPNRVLGSDRLHFAAAVLIYGLSTIYSVLLYRKGFRRDTRISYISILVAFGLHSLAMIERGLATNSCPINNLYEACVFIGWALVAIYLVIGLWRRLRFLGAFASPLLFGLGVFALMPSLDVASSVPSYGGGGTSLHAALIMLSYGAFGLASLAAVMYLCQEHDLKHDKIRAVLSLLPPIQRLDSVMSRSLVAGFLLLTAGLTVGALWVELPPGATYWQDPKVHWSVLVWMIYLSMIVMRWRFAQRGRRMAWGTIGSFAFVLLTFWGTNLLSGIHHP